MRQRREYYNSSVCRLSSGTATDDMTERFYVNVYGITAAVFARLTPIFAVTITMKAGKKCGSSGCHSTLINLYV